MIEEHFPSVVTRPIHHFANLYGTVPFCPDNNWRTTGSIKHCTTTSTGHWASTRTTIQTTYCPIYAWLSTLNSTTKPMDACMYGWAIPSAQHSLLSTANNESASSVTG